MKAIRVESFGDPEVMHLGEVATPEVGAGQVLVRVHAVGVNPVDTYLRSGMYTFQPPLPYTPGTDAAGVVEAVGEGVTRVKVDDRVYSAGTLSGAYAEQTLCAEHQVYPLPDNTTFGQGAALGIPYGTAYRALFHRAEAEAGDIVLIHGASGGVGLAAVQLARAAGMTVIGTAGSDQGLSLVSEHGAHHVLNHHEDNHLDEIPRLTGGRGVNVIIENLANANLGKDLGVLANRGCVIVVGSRGEVTINPRDLMTRDAEVRGMTLMNITDAERDSIHAAIHTGLKNGILNPVVSREMSLADAAQSHHAVIESSTHGKIVLLP